MLRQRRLHPKIFMPLRRTTKTHKRATCSFFLGLGLQTACMHHTAILYENIQKSFDGLHLLLGHLLIPLHTLFCIQKILSRPNSYVPWCSLPLLTCQFTSHSPLSSFPPEIVRYLPSFITSYGHIYSRNM